VGSQFRLGLDVLVAFLAQSLAIAQFEGKKLQRDVTEIFTRAIQPTLWLLVFGQVMTRVRAIPTGSLSYLEFMAPGILAQSVLFSAIFYGIAIIWERDLGILHKLLVSPAYRSALVFGKALSAGFRGVSQTAIIYVVAGALGVHLRLLTLPLVLLVVVLGSAIFATFSLIVACIVKTRERFMGIGQVLTMPLFFASNAIYPIAIMPAWLRVVARGNPLSYIVDALRAAMVVGASSTFGLEVDVTVMLATLVLLIAVAAKLYPTVVH
jgi:ABC-2 type transport system permease protein